MSSAPAIANTGVVISGSRSVTSNTARQSHTCAYDSASVSRRAPRRAAATDGSRPANPAANQRSADPSTIDSVPESRTVAARTRHCSGSPITAPVHSRAAERTRSGASSRICSPTAPPTESPAYEKACPGAMSSASASTPAASSGDTERCRRRRAASVPGQVPAHDADVFGKAFGHCAPEVGDRCAE